MIRVIIQEDAESTRILSVESLHLCVLAVAPFTEQWQEHGKLHKPSLKEATQRFIVTVLMFSALGMAVSEVSR